MSDDKHQDVSADLALSIENKSVSVADLVCVNDIVDLLSDITLFEIARNRWIHLQ